MHGPLQERKRQFLVPDAPLIFVQDLINIITPTPLKINHKLLISFSFIHFKVKSLNFTSFYMEKSIRRACTDCCSKNLVQVFYGKEKPSITENIKNWQKQIRQFQVFQRAKGQILLKKLSEISKCSLISNIDVITGSIRKISRLNRQMPDQKSTLATFSQTMFNILWTIGLQTSKVIQDVIDGNVQNGILEQGYKLVGGWELCVSVSIDKSQLIFIYETDSQIPGNQHAYYNVQSNYLSQNHKMMKFGNNFEENHTFYDSQAKYYLNNLQYEEDPIEMFLNEEVLFAKAQNIKQIESSDDFLNTHDSEAMPNPKEIKETHQNQKKKSIFHNFQKHLITLIKKSNNFAQKDESGKEGLRLTSQLWSAFMKTRSFNKKILHIAFGVLENSKIDVEFARLCEQFPQFKDIYNKNSISDIVEAQRLIRNQFVEHALSLSREEAEANSNVSRFQEFFEYYQSFIRELRSGPMTKRMTKSRKSKVVERLEGKTTVQ